MTAKLLSWTTFGLLVAGAYPFVSDLSVAPSVSSGTYAAAALPLATALPACNKCHIKPPEEYQKIFAIDLNALCAPPEPYRMSARLATKVICEGGGWWNCDDTVSMRCSPYIERPPCPDDTCKQYPPGTGPTEPGTN